MIKRAAIWVIVGLSMAALVPGLFTDALGQDEDRSQAIPQSPEQTEGTDTTATGANGNQAQETAPTPETPDAPANGRGPTTQPTNGQQGQFQWILPLMLVGFVLLWIFGSRKSRTAEKKRQKMLSNLKKGDRVTSIGGIVGTVVDVRDNEVVVKVDDTANTRLRFVRKAISHVGPPEEAEDEK
ncbi:MAG: preprotein translocase subunit YajC [Planctomycetota bacterium]